jgi:thiamine-phosphate pyrophosphorylase
MRRRPLPPPLYAIADAGALGGAAALPAAVAEMALAGVGWVQLRLKDGTADGELLRLGEECRRRLEGSSTVLWLDDRADLAALLAAAGVHLGQRDLPPEAARSVVGEEVWIGASSHNDDELAAVDGDAAVDLVAFGPVFATTGKEDPDPVVGLPGLRRARRRTAKPLVAIGGIDAGNLPEVLAAGADGAAVIGAICRRGDRPATPREVGESCRRLLAAAEEGA